MDDLPLQSVMSRLAGEQGMVGAHGDRNLTTKYPRKEKVEIPKRLKRDELTRWNGGAAETCWQKLARPNPLECSLKWSCGEAPTSR